MGDLSAAAYAPTDLLLLELAMPSDYSNDDPSFDLTGDSAESGHDDGLTLFPAAVIAKMLENGTMNRDRCLNHGGETVDMKPVVKIFNPLGAATWLLSEIDPDEPSVAFGLCDLGFGTPELGSVSIDELIGYRSRIGTRLERDVHFVAKKTLTEYWEEARAAGAIRT